MTYSTSSRPRRFHSVRPKPIEKRSTLMPSRRATQKRPKSWHDTSTPSATTKAAMDQANSSMRHRRARGADEAARRGPRERIHLEHGLQGLVARQARAGGPVERLLDQGRDAGEWNAFLQECLHRDLVGGIEDIGEDAPAPQSVAR